MFHTKLNSSVFKKFQFYTSVDIHVVLLFQWSQVFPTELKTMHQSEMFVKKLLAVGLSSITYLRTIFPEVCSSLLVALHSFFDFQMLFFFSIKLQKL